LDRALAFARLAELLPEARARFGVREIAIFGSVARRDASESSDLDVLVDFVGGATCRGGNKTGSATGEEGGALER
jgi:predicted nucleotidyltransferase